MLSDKHYNFFLQLFIYELEIVNLFPGIHHSVCIYFESESELISLELVLILEAPVPQNL
jgi:hypothetical protein